MRDAFTPLLDPFDQKVFSNSAEPQLSKMVLQAPTARLSVLKDQHLRLLFRVGNSQKSQGARSGLYGGWGITSNYTAQFNLSPKWHIAWPAPLFFEIHDKQTNNTKCNIRYLASLLRDPFEIFFSYSRELLLHNHDVDSPKISVAASAAHEYSFRKHTSYALPVWAGAFIIATFM